MPRACTVCQHPDAVEINEALVIEGASFRDIARRFGVGKDAVQRHREHIPKLLVKASEAGEIADADALLERVEALATRTKAMLDKAEEGGELRLALAAVREARGNLELLAKLTGELAQEGTTTVNVIQSPEYLEVKAVIVGTLEQYPEARAAVLEGLRGVGDG